MAIQILISKNINNKSNVTVFIRNYFLLKAIIGELMIENSITLSSNDRYHYIITAYHVKVIYLP